MADNNGSNAVQFYTRREGATYGPFSLDQVAQYVREKRIDANSEMSIVGSNTWTRAAETNELKGLFAAPPPPPLGAAAQSGWPSTTTAASATVAIGEHKANTPDEAPKDMTMSEAVNICLRQKYATFHGRARRAEYWWFVAAYFVAAMAFAVAYGILSVINNTFATIVCGLAFGIVTFGMIVPGIAVAVRRLHDRDVSGWWYLGVGIASLIPIVGGLAGIAFMVVAALRGTVGPNRFGPDPLGGA